MGYWRYNYQNNRLERVPEEEWPEWEETDDHCDTVNAVVPGKEAVDYRDTERLREWSEENKL